MRHKTSLILAKRRRQRVAAPNCCEVEAPYTPVGLVQVIARISGRLASH